jgi:hypothetical protein
MPLNLTRGAARELVGAADVPTLRRAGVLVEDTRRERPRWFDGRFLAARDLIREQQYFLTREADLGRAAGSGVASGLHVAEGSGPQVVRVDAGHGITPAGELVLLPRALDVALTNIASAEQLSARFGLSRIAQPPLRSRTGLFVLALRPVEYTANPIGAYPSQITGQRTVEDGDVVEATAVVLVPWVDDGAEDALDARRGAVARSIFVTGTAGGVSANVLPLAMLALQNNSVVWIDEALVRRELGANRGDLPGLGLSPRALRLAHLMQYQDHLHDVLARSNGRTFPANAYFPALPGAGPLPAGAINALDFTQNFFPAEIDVDFSIVPEDELPALVEDALALQPIDLSAPPESLDSTAVVIVAPVPRNEWRAVLARLTSVTRIVKPAAPNLLSQRKPFEVLQKLRIPRGTPPVLDPTNPSDAEWQRLARLSTLWFVRRRHLALRDDQIGAARALSGVDERVVEAQLRTRLGALGLTTAFDNLVARSSPAALGTATQLLSSTRLTGSPALTAATLGALTAASTATAAAEGQRQTLDLAAVLRVAADVTAPGAGTGLEKVEQIAPLNSQTLQQFAAGTAWKRLDADAKVASGVELRRIALGMGGVPVRSASRPESVRAPVPAAEPVVRRVAQSKKPVAATPDKAKVMAKSAQTPTKPPSPARSGRRRKSGTT